MIKVTPTELRTRVARRVLEGIVVLIWVLLMVRVLKLQILDYDIYSPISEKNALRQEIISASRGLILDRNGTILVENEPVFTLTLTPVNFDTASIPLLATLLDLSVQEIRSKYDESRRFSWHRPSRLYSEVTLDRFSVVEENSWRLPGIGFLIESRRNYPSSVNASHVLGYLREADRSEIEKDRTLQLGDKIGKSGVEMIYDRVLRGTIGSQYVQVNALGQTLGAFGEDQSVSVEPIKGMDLTLTIDSELQALAEELFLGKTGGAVAMNPKTGEILALVSAPDYEVGRLAGRLDVDYWSQVNSDSLTPLFNRAVSARQPPGSIVKPIFGIIGQQMELLNPQQSIQTSAVYMRGRPYRDLAPPGRYDLKKAIAMSSNYYFFALIDKIATQKRLNAWAAYLRDFGLGSTSRIDLPSAVRGVVPDSTVMNATFGERKWGVGDVMNLGIGQGLLSVSPIQMAVAISVVANRGYRPKPFVVQSMRQSDGTMVVTEPELQPVNWIVESDFTQPVIDGMQQAIQEGSSRYFTRIPDLNFAGKTGTAQNPHGIDHGWFVGFAPVEDPTIVVAVLVENGGFGSVSAAPIGSLMVEQHLKGSVSRNFVVRHVKTYKPKEESESTSIRAVAD